MLFKVDSKKSAYHEGHIFVPNYSSLQKKDRNEVNCFVGGCCEYEETDLAESLVGPGIGLAWITIAVLAAVTENPYFIAVFGITSGVFALAIIASIIWYIIVDSIRVPQLDIHFISTDDVRWKHLMLAFKDDFALWQRMMNEINVEWKYWELKYASKLALRLSDAVSEYLSYIDLEANRDLIVHEVSRIFVDHDIEQEEANQAKLARKQAEADGARLLFEQKIQMAADDIMYREMNQLPTSYGMSI